MRDIRTAIYCIPIYRLVALFLTILALFISLPARAADREPAPIPLPPAAIEKWKLREISPSHHAAQLLQRILVTAKYRGPAVRIYCSESDEIQNAAATILNLGETVLTPEGPRQLHIPLIMYNANFMTQFSFASGNEYVPLYILAHELGHIVFRHPDRTNPLSLVQHPWEKELEADEFAGAILARMGAKAEDIQLAHRMLCVEKWFRKKVQNDGTIVLVFGEGDAEVRVASLVRSSATHPDAVRRIQAIARGWRRGGGAGDIEANLHAIFRDLATELVRWEPDDRPAAKPRE